MPHERNIERRSRQKGSKINELMQQIKKQDAVINTLANELTEHRILLETDAKTGLPNGTYFERKLNEAIQELRESKAPSSVVIALDVNYFKSLNNIIGGIPADRLIAGIATVLRKEIRGSRNKAADIVARSNQAGDEFSILLLDTTPDKVESRLNGIINGIKGITYLVKSPDNRHYYAIKNVTIAWGAKLIDTTLDAKANLHVAEQTMHEQKNKQHKHKDLPIVQEISQPEYIRLQKGKNVVDTASISIDRAF